ncbi:hypothetical protein [Streptomyces sp. NPDC059247]|uniref:hypothetical protein n=1 Tax=Streptomyces sp. NPDC059247 TaxID=3346790 RepID=UPI0036C6C32C
MVFIKGLPLDHERIGELETEAVVAPFLPAGAPAVLWEERAGGLAAGVLRRAPGVGLDLLR